VASSAGTRPSGEVNQLAIQVMKECGVDISNQKSKIIT
jgi:protein-tyrosine-phosphatase